MKEIYNILLLLIIFCMGFSSCSDDEVVKTPLEAPTLAVSETKVKSLQFEWQPVNNATQYAYELYDARENIVLGGITNASSIIATGLQPSTTYTLKVWAYAGLDTDKTTSPIATLTATTGAVTPLESPVPLATMGNGGVTISWPAVEHATSYRYHYEGADHLYVEGETETNSVTLTGLPIGTYTIYITATSTDESYSDSQPISLTFERTKAEAWRKTGTYYSAALDKYFEADIVAYDDGSYTIENPMGEEGYSIGFTVPAGGTEILPEATPDEYGYYSFYTSSQYYIAIYPASGYSQFTGNEYAGEVWFCTYLYDSEGNAIGDYGYDDFSWSEGDEIPEGCQDEVPAMLSTTWAQYAPYYNMTPQVDGKQCLTGCVATALAQILNYYQYPDKLADGTVIDWAHMLPSYEGEYTEAEGNAVALLMARCGNAVNMDYGTDVSTCYPSELENGFANEFGYLVRYYGYRDYPVVQDSKKWKEIIFRELSAGHPVLYGGTSYKDGYNNYFSHSFVIDGYNAQGLVHVNYGFAGAGDGWYPIDKLPLKYGNWDEEFDTYQTLVVLHRPQDGTIDYEL